MKIQFFLALFLFCLIGTTATAQINPTPNLGTVTVFSDDGDNFTLFINAEKQNTKPAPNVKAEDVNDIMISLKVVFEDPTKPELKKSVMRGAKDCTYTITKNKKGEYVIKVKSCSNPFPQGPPPAAPIPPTIPASLLPPPASAPAGGNEKLTAEYDDNGTISVSNGDSYRVTKTKTTGGLPYPHVVMKAPKGAKVTITYDGNSEKYSSEPPFDYSVSDFNNNNSYFRLTVDQGGPDKTWYVRIQNGTGYTLTIQ